MVTAVAVHSRAALRPSPQSTIGGGSIDVTINPLNGNGLVGGDTGLTTFTFNSLQNQAITFDFGLNAALFAVAERCDGH